MRDSEINRRFVDLANGLLKGTGYRLIREGDNGYGSKIVLAKDLDGYGPNAVMRIWAWNDPVEMLRGSWKRPGKTVFKALEDMMGWRGLDKDSKDGKNACRALAALAALRAAGSTEEAVMRMEVLDAEA